MALAVVDSVTAELRGITSFYDLVPAVPRVEIGATQYGRRFWGGPTNPACKLLMLGHAFEAWGCVRVALRCDADNDRSAGAIRRLGAHAEGVLRNHRRRHDGTVGDTAYFSITDDDWAVVQAGLRERLAP
jgi:RimJ/RimL family protein N-acetyltransferase